MRLTKELYLNLTFGRLVSVDYTRLDEVVLLVKKRKPEEYKPEEWRNTIYWPDDEEGQSIISQFFTLGNSINFRYWWIGEDNKFEYCQGPKGGSNQRGAFYMWRSLRLAQKRGIPLLDAKWLSRISMNEIKEVFQDDNNQNALPILRERQKNWRDLGIKLLEYWDGQFFNLIKASKGSLADFVRYSREFRAFDDPLCKMTMVNAILHSGRGVAHFNESILPGIDYQLMKQQLRLGILLPKEHLKKKMLSEKLCDRLLSKREARELRNACLASFMYTMEKTSVSGEILDNIWWLNRRVCEDRNPSCEQCLFKAVCNRNVAYGIPLELTRYY